MAITRAQIARELYKDGKRVGLKGGADAATESFAISAGGGGQKGKDYAASVGARPDSTFNPGGSDGGGPTFDGAQASTITKAQSDAAKDFKQLQQFKKNLTKPNFTPGFVASMLTKVFPGNVDYRKEFLARNPQLLEYFNSLSEEDQKSNATMNALANIMNIDGTTYEDFLAYEKGSPGLKYSGDVGNLEKYVSSYEMNPDGTFKLSPKGYKIAKTYDYKERPGDDRGGDGIMSDYERRLLELENQLKTQQAAAPTTTQNPFAFRFLADGGRAEYRVGGASGREYDQGSPKSSSPNQGPAGGASAGGNYGGNRNPDQTYGGGSGNQSSQKINIPKPIKDVGNTAGELMFLKNVFELNPVGIMKNIGTKMFLDNLISDADTQQDQNMMLTDVSQADLDAKKEIRGFQDMDYDTYKSIMEFKGGTNISPFEFKGLQEGTITEPGRYTAADGGIMNTDIVGGMMDGNMDEMGRQMYGLGKLVKKATRAVKKIAKSPIGKAALLYTGAGALGNLAAGKGFASMFSGFTSPSTFLGRVPGIFSKGGLQNIASRIGLGKFKNVGSQRLFEASKLGSFLTSPAGLIAASSALPFLFKGDDEEEFDPYRGPDIDIAAIRGDPYGAMGGAYRFAADGGLMRPGYQEGGDAEPVAKKTMPLIDMDGKEKDYRETGGFVDMGRMERADDVPARLSKNEFVFTADAVRNAGEGDIDKGAEVMYNMMKNLEAGGEVSEESQGLEGARKMFQTSQRLGEVI